MFDSNLNWNYSNMLSTPWVLSAINPSTDATRMVVQVQTQSSSFAANPEGSLLSTNTIEWFSSGNQQTVVPSLLDECKHPETALGGYNGANSFISSANSAFLNNNTLVALPSPANVPAILTLTVPSLDFSRSMVLQAPVQNFARAATHDQSTYLTRIIRSMPVQDPMTMIQGSTPMLSASAAPTFISGLAPSLNPCLRLPFVGPSMPPVSEVPQSQNAWVMVMPNKDHEAQTEPEVETTSYATELPTTCSSGGSIMAAESSELTSETKQCSTHIEATAIPPECTSEAVPHEVPIAITESVCTCESADKLGWSESACGKCESVIESPETYESDATCRTITTTSVRVEAGIQAAEIETCLDSTFDSEHDEFEPTSQAISSILRKLLEEEIENANKDSSDKTFEIEEDPVDNATFIDLNQLDTTPDECDGPTNGVKDVLMTGAPSCVKRHLTGSQSRAKKLKTVLETAMRRPTCTKCGDKFSSTFNLRKHYMGQENDKSYQCAKCKQTFTGCYSYKRHSWTHDRDIGDDPPPENEIVTESSDEEGIQPYGCAQCGKEFSDSFLLTEHCATHVRGRPFTCTQCEMCFESVALLEKHSKIHARTKTVLFNGYEAESESSSE